MKKKSCFFCWAFLVCISTSAIAQINLEKDSVNRKGKKRKLFAFPAVIYSPETTLALGGAGNFYFKLGRDTTVRTSYVQALGLYTLRKQAVFGFESMIFFHKEKYILKTKGSASYFPDRFWGLGNDSPNDYERYTVGQFYLSPQLLRRAYKRLFLGPAFEIQNVFSFEYGSGMPPGTSKFDVQKVPGRKGSYVAGLGAVASWDSRDNTFSSSKGFYFSYYVSSFSPAFGSRFSYTSHSLDVRKYFSVGKNDVIAFQFVTLANIGMVPVRSMANIGSNSIMRGYYEGRYTANNLIALQAEYRFPVYKRFGMVVFAATGRVADHTAQLFTVRGQKPSLGTGLRYAVDPKEKLNFRFDVGFGQQSNGFYFYLTEAF
ncbi:MAG: hypothetical protein OJF59_003307 [Cytophagales bacterium]|nr:BamA/TamA family outer membrane protein [Bacteroidota bacterium]MBS1982161.1 BamA/TamA family outer membrane protein [Bacteroidota bacterium]WHZ09551.1 MAG: hypothetical protein OJF59_003307 [Cytophagales bacterium]